MVRFQDPADAPVECAEARFRPHRRAHPDPTLSRSREVPEVMPLMSFREWKCTKCLGVMLFLKANNVDPQVMGYRKADVEALPERLAATKLRLDPDELEQSIFLAFIKGFDLVSPKPHAEGIHIYPATSNPDLIPEEYRAGVMGIIGKYARGVWILKSGDWFCTERL